MLRPNQVASLLISLELFETFVVVSGYACKPILVFHFGVDQSWTKDFSYLSPVRKLIQAGNACLNTGT